MKNTCVLCGSAGEEFCGYIVCDACRSALGLFTDATIKKHMRLFESGEDHSYEEEVRNRLDLMEKDYIRKRIKLLHIKERIENLG